MGGATDDHYTNLTSLLVAAVLSVIPWSRSVVERGGRGGVHCTPNKTHKHIDVSVFLSFCSSLVQKKQRFYFFCRRYCFVLVLPHSIVS